MANPLCVCSGPGFCSRHKMNKDANAFKICRGDVNAPDCGKMIFVEWEKGKLGATAPEKPDYNPDGFCNRSRGLGDTIARAITTITAGLLKDCGGCKDRAAALNHLFPNEAEPVDKVVFDETLKRNFIMHIYPNRQYEGWKWNCDEVLKRKDLFNGKRIVAIARSPKCVSPAEVKEYLKDFTDDFIEINNHTTLREVVSFVPLLERVESHVRNEVTFYCHSKGVRRDLAPHEKSWTVYEWARTMYETCLDNWDLVHKYLSETAMTGSFKHYKMFNLPRNHRWHYSGTFWWFRNKDVFQRNWRYVDQFPFGVEAWPGHMFKPNETSCLFGDDISNLYDRHIWDSYMKRYEEWKMELASIREKNPKLLEVV